MTPRNLEGVLSELDNAKPGYYDRCAVSLTQAMERGPGFALPCCDDKHDVERNRF